VQLAAAGVARALGPRVALVLPVLAGPSAALVPSSPQELKVSARLSRMPTVAAALSRIGLV
jgi:hypothetical protein